MREKWIVETKKGDFNGLSAKLKVSPLAVRCLMNRGVESEQEMREFLYGTLDDLHDPFLMKGMDEAVREIVKAKEQGRKVAIASDFDCDGIFSAYILWKGFQKIGLDSEIFTPDRVKEGYGLNRRIVDEALAGGRDFLVTCDNGIAANEEVDYAKKLGMTVIVTDHHEVQEQMPNADAILDPKRDDETYPFRGLCGAGVAFKLICALYDAQQVPAEAKDELLEYAGIATVADVMELQGENRILVKYGLKALSHTKNIGLRALLKVQELEDKQITAGHIGFILGPCFNAAGRIATVAESFSLLMEEDEEKALEKAERLKEINESRKQMTEDGAEEAYLKLEEKEAKNKLPKVLIVLLPDTHESLVGIIAGRVKERYNRPTIVFTETEDGLVKGSGRSIEVYDMFHELMACKDLMERFGGHKMAAGMTLHEKDLPELEKRLNENCVLTEEDFRPVVFGHAQHVDRADYRRLGGFDRVVLVVDRRCRAGEVVNLLDFGHIGVDDVVADDFEVGVFQQMADVALVSREVVVDADDVVALFKQAFTQVGTDESGTTGDEYSLHWHEIVLIKACKCTIFILNKLYLHAQIVTR